MTLPYGLSVSSIASKLRDITIIILTSWTIAFGIVTVVFEAKKDVIRDSARDFLGVNELATKQQTDEIIKTLNQITGADRILYRDPVFSYVKEPVTPDEPVTARYLVKRNSHGASCLAKTAIPLFTDERNIPLPGTLLSPIRQFGTELTPAEVTFLPPDGLFPGRVCITVAVTYRCGGEDAFDQLDPICYVLQSS